MGGVSIISGSQISLRSQLLSLGQFLFYRCVRTVTHQLRVLRASGAISDLVILRLVAGLTSLRECPSTPHHYYSDIRTSFTLIRVRFRCLHNHEGDVALCLPMSWHIWIVVSTTWCCPQNKVVYRIPFNYTTCVSHPIPLHLEVLLPEYSMAQRVAPYLLEQYPHTRTVYEYENLFYAW